MTGSTEVSLTRRRLLQAAAVTSVAMAGLDLLEGAGAASSGVAAHLRRASFAPLTGQTLASSVANLRLDEVADVADRALAGRDDVFVLRLSGPGRPALEQGLAELSHPQLGGFSMFVVPIDDPSARQRYEVTVDRSVRLATAQTDAPQPLADRLGAAAAATPPVLGTTGTKVRTPLVQSAHLARRAGRLSVELRLAPDRQFTAVRASLLRGDRALARGSRRLDARQAARVPLSHEPQRVGPGQYDLLVTATDRLGRHTSERRRVTLG
ncbi:MAG: hypothetical protein QOH12_3382 [Solirubrobacteraceae bacterium]|jgi:hypothetical protein|nr:hypothetical protein [Solirubrobacteraceae bacterium]